MVFLALNLLVPEPTAQKIEGFLRTRRIHVNKATDSANFKIYLSYRWTDVVEYCKKGIQFCVRNKTDDNLHTFYEKIIEAHVKRKNYDGALEVFKNIKKFNLNATNADDVDFKVVFLIF